MTKHAVVYQALSPNHRTALHVRLDIFEVYHLSNTSVIWKLSRYFRSFKGQRMLVHSMSHYAQDSGLVWLVKQESNSLFR